MSSQKVTTDYSMFKSLKGNRGLNMQHVNRLAKVMKEDNMNEKFPIVVNTKMQVLDGQHRLAALEKIEAPVHYRIQDDVSIENVRVLNQVVRKWSWQDLARSYVDNGNDSYQIILDLNEERPSLFDLTVACQLANINPSSSNTRPLSNYFYGGGLELSEGQRSNLQKMANQLGDIADTQPHFKTVARFSNSRDLPRTYSTAMIRIMKSDDYNHHQFLQRLSANNIELPPVVDINEALREIEKAYNYSLKESSRVRLF